METYPYVFISHLLHYKRWVPFCDRDMFWGIVLPLFVVFFLVYPMKYAHFRNILPIFTHSPFDMLISAKQSALEFLGFETILIFYPFIEKGKSLKRWAHAGIF